MQWICLKKYRKWTSFLGARLWYLLFCLHICCNARFPQIWHCSCTAGPNTHSRISAPFFQSLPSNLESSLSSVGTAWLLALCGCLQLFHQSAPKDKTVLHLCPYTIPIVYNLSSFLTQPVVHLHSTIYDKFLFSFQYFQHPIGISNLVYLIFDEYAPEAAAISAFLPLRSKAIVPICFSVLHLLELFFQSLTHTVRSPSATIPISGDLVLSRSSAPAKPTKALHFQLLRCRPLLFCCAQ